MTTKKSTPKTKLFVVKSCVECPNCDTKLTKGYGYAEDYFCKAAGNKVIAGYVEWLSEAPQVGKFPTWCPLKDGK